MLFGQDFGRRHDSSLKIVGDGHQHGEEGHHCFTTADIDLNETVHREGALHVVQDLT